MTTEVKKMSTRKKVALVMMLIILALLVTLLILSLTGRDTDTPSLAAETPPASTPTPETPPPIEADPVNYVPEEEEDPNDGDVYEGLVYDANLGWVIIDGDYHISQLSRAIGGPVAVNGLLPGGRFLNDERFGVTLNWVDAQRVVDEHPTFGKNVDFFASRSGISTEKIVGWAEALKAAGLERVTTLGIYLFNGIEITDEEVREQIAEAWEEVQDFVEDIPIIRVDHTRFRVWNTWYSPTRGPSVFLDTRPQARLGVVPLMEEYKELALDLSARAMLASDCRNIFFWEEIPVEVPPNVPGTPTTPPTTPPPSTPPPTTPPPTTPPPADGEDPPPTTPPPVQTVTITVRFLHVETHRALRAAESTTVNVGDRFDVSGRTNPTISGYRRTQVEGATSGTATANHTVTVWFSGIQIDMPPPGEYIPEHGPDDNRTIIVDERGGLPVDENNTHFPPAPGQEVIVVIPEPVPAPIEAPEREPGAGGSDVN